MVADSFSFQDDIPCFNCGEQVNLGDDYEVHLRVVHSIKQNFHTYMGMAVEEKMRRKRGKEEKEIDVFDIEEEVETGEAVVKDKAQSLEAKPTSKSLKQSAINGLAEIVDMFEGKTVVNFDEEKLESGKDYEDELWKAFEELEAFIGKGKGADKKVITKTSETEQVSLEETVVVESDARPWYCRGIYFTCKSQSQAGKTCGKRCDGRIVFRNHLRDNHGVKLTGIKSKELTPYASDFDNSSLYECKECKTKVFHDKSGITAHLDTKHRISLEKYGEKHESGGRVAAGAPLSPRASARSGASSGLARAARRRRCPRCTFTTTQAGIEEGEGAVHLTTEHGLTPALMAKDPQAWKFRPVKTKT